jgi:hypothetical protein
VADGVSSQLYADLCASAGLFESAYRSASLAPAEPLAGLHCARVALFADALNDAVTAQRYSEHTVALMPDALVDQWIVWLLQRGGVHPAARLLRANEARMPDDPRWPWRLALTLATVAHQDALAERRVALARAYALDPAIHPHLPLQLILAHRAIERWEMVERVSRAELEKHPADAEMAWQLSHAQWRRNDAAAAEATMRAIDVLAPGNAAVVAVIALYLAEQARFADSEAVLCASLALDPGGLGTGRRSRRTRIAPRRVGIGVAAL